MSLKPNNVHLTAAASCCPDCGEQVRHTPHAKWVRVDGQSQLRQRGQILHACLPSEPSAVDAERLLTEIKAWRTDASRVPKRRAK